MDKFKIRINRKFTFLLGASALGIFLGGNVIGVFQGKPSSKLNAAEAQDELSLPEIPIKEENKLTHDLRFSIEKAFRNATEWPEILKFGDRSAKIEYSFNPELDSYIKKTLKQYRSDYSTVTVIDNESGQVLAAVGHIGKDNKFDSNLVLTATHPSASLIKIITAAELMQNTKVNRETPFEFRGKSTTLFKYQLNESKKNRWVRTQSFESAFAQSNNVIFGKAAIQNLDSVRLVKMAENFGYNHTLINEFDFMKSNINGASDDYRLAELASGFNDETVISPVHAATMASIIANNGVLKSPRVISRLVDSKTGELVWENALVEKRVLSTEASKEMQGMMEMTIDGGTARKSFRKMNTGYKNALEIGGKTGSITGGKPFGKRDWFAAYAMPRDSGRGKGISISVMNVNVKKWHIKSTMLAKNIIEYYYNNIQPMPITMVKMPRFISENRKKRVRTSNRTIASARLKKRTETRINKKKINNTKRHIGKRNERKPNRTL